MAEYENRLREAANALAKKQLGLDPKSNQNENNDKLPEIFLSVEGQYLISLNESFRKLCGSIQTTYSLKELSDNTLLLMANKVNERAINGCLESIGDLSQDSEISAILQYVSFVQNEEDLTNAKYDGELYENDSMNGGFGNAKNIMGNDSKEQSVLMALVMADRLNKDVISFENATTFEEKAAAAESLRATNYLGKTKAFHGDNGKITEIGELPSIAGVWNFVITHKNSMSLEDFKTVALDVLDGLNIDKYGDFLEKVKNVTSIDDLDKALGDEFFRVRTERNPNAKETREQLDERMHDLSKYRSKDNKQNLIDSSENLKGLTLEEIARRERERVEELTRRKVLAQKYSEAMNEIASGKSSFDKLQDTISEVKSAGFADMYKAMLNRVKDKSVKENNIGLASVYKELAENDREENAPIQVETMDIGHDDTQLGDER